MFLKQGELAYSFGDLLRKIWAIDGTSYSPRQFKARLARFAPQFSGFNQHDSQVSKLDPTIDSFSISVNLLVVLLAAVLIALSY